MTAQDIFNIAMTLIDETPVNGVFDANRTSDYKEKTPYILTMIQHDISRISPLYKKLEILLTGTEDKYIKLDLPNDYISVYNIVDSNLEATNDYRIIGNDLYVKDNFNGILIYRYSPTEITALTDTIEFSDYIAGTVMAYGLASNLIIKEDANVASYLNSKYEESKLNIKTIQPATRTTIIDKYDASCSC